MKTSSSLPSDSIVFAYPGGTFHLAPWAAYFAGITLLWLNYFYGDHFKSERGLFWIGFASICFLNGFYSEWSLRNQPGQILVNETGLTCTLPWGRRRQFSWEDIREIRCTARRLYAGFSHWEVRGLQPTDRITFSFELKCYKTLLRIIRDRAPRLQRFDPLPADLQDN